MGAALWRDADSVIDPEWRALKAALLEDAGGGFWLHWYEAALAGRPLDIDMLTEIALLPDEDWDKGPDHIDPMIAGIWERYELRKQVKALKAELAQSRVKYASAVQRSHNQPPELLEDDVRAGQSLTLIWDLLDEAEEELEKEAPDPSRLKKIGEKLWAAFVVVSKYCGGKADKMVDKASEVIAETGTKWAIRVGAGSIVSQQPAVQTLAKGLIDYGTRFLSGGG